MKNKDFMKNMSRVRSIYPLFTFSHAFNALLHTVCTLAIPRNARKHL